MTREVAIKAIQDFIGWFKEDSLIRKALEMAIQALSQEPCDDVVSRILTRMWNCRGKHTTSIDKVKMEQIIRDELPSVTQKSGKWISLENRFELGDRVKCSECGQIFVVGDDVSRNFCPNCGARMESEE